MGDSPESDPFKILGLPGDADEPQIRARYLELVRQFPPERDPARFQEIRAAFEAAKDPLVMAKKLLRAPDDEEVPDWLEVLEQAARNPPPLTVDFLLGLGNRGDAPGRRSENSE